MWWLLLLIVVIVIFYQMYPREGMLPRGVNNNTFVNNTRGTVAFLSGGTKRVLTPQALAVCPPPISATLSMAQWNAIPNGVLFTKESCKSM